MSLLDLIRGTMIGVHAYTGVDPKYLYVGARNASELKKIPGVQKGPRGKLYIFGMEICVRMDMDEFTVLCVMDKIPDPCPANDPGVWVPVKPP